MANRLEKVFTYKFDRNEQLKVTIGINDDCKNGHADFTVCYAHYVKGELVGWYHDFDTLKDYGAPHRVIPEKDLEIFRKFEPLHLCDQDGVHWYPISNGWYHLNEGNLRTFANAMRVSIAEAERASKLVTSKLYLYAWLCQGGHIERWKREANEAIAILEELCGDKFDFVRTKENELNEYKQIDTSKFVFNEEVSQKIITFHRLKVITDELARCEEYYQGQLKKLEEGNNLKMYVLNKVADYVSEHLPSNPIHVLRCFIVYDHNETVVFNWHDCGDNIPYEYAYGLCKYLSELNDSLQYKVGKVLRPDLSLSNEEFEWYKKLEEEGFVKL